MKRYLLLGGLLLTGLVGGWLLGRQEQTTDNPITESSQTTDQAEPKAGTDPASDKLGDIASNGLASGFPIRPATAVQRTPQYFLTPRPDDPDFRVGPDIPLPDLPPPDVTERYPSWLEARTPEEALWLDRHGYPTQKEVDALAQTSANDLAERAAQGDLAAMALLGKKQLQNQETLGIGYDNLKEATMQGSIWAILALADHQLHIGNYHDAFALYNLAALRGDWVSPSLHMISMPAQLPQHAFRRVPQQTAYHFATMQYLRQQRGLPLFVNTPRPNIFNRPDGSEPIGVYRRRQG